jgi:Protein of unknown function (DUF2637)
VREWPWQDIARRVLTAVCAIGAVTASFIFLTDLARQNGWPAYAAPLLPLCIDALGGMALLRTGHHKHAGKVAAGAIAASFTGNALSHLYATGVIAPTALSIGLVGGIPALSLGLCVYLNKRKADDATRPAMVEAADTAADAGGDLPVLRSDDRASAAGRVPTPRSATGTTRAKTATRATTTRRPGTPSLNEQRARTIVDNGWQDLTWEKLQDAEHLDCGYVQAGNARKLARELLAAVPNGNATLVE